MTDPRTPSATVRVGNARLLKLAAFLEKLPRKRFDYSNWVGHGWAGKEDLSCGTTACALGWACTMPEFRRLGARLVGCGRPFLDGELSSGAYDVSKHLFVLDYREHGHLFFPATTEEERATPKQVAKKIRRFVKERGYG